MKIFQKILTLALAALVAVSLASPAACAAEYIEAPADSVILVEATTGEVLYEYNSALVYEDANLSKIMTLMLAAQAIEENRASAEDAVVITENMLPGEDVEYRGVDLTAGESISLSDLMYCLAMASADDAANAIAVHIAGSIPAFVDRMNAKAAELGCSKTVFVTPSTLNAEGQYTTVRDTYRLFSAAMSYPMLETVFSSMRYTVPATDVSAKRSLNAENALGLKGGDYYCESCTGACLSGSSETGYSLSAAADNGELSLIAVLNGDWSSELFEGAGQMIEWGYENFAWRKVISTDTVMGYRNVELSRDDKPVKVVPSSDITLLLDNSIPDSAFEKDVVIYSERDGGKLTAPLSPGDILGEMTLRLNGKKCGTVKLVSATNIDLMRSVYIKSTIKETLQSKTVKRIIAGVIVMFVLYFAYVIFDAVRRIRKKRNIKAIRRRLADERRMGGGPAPAEPLPVTRQNDMRQRIESVPRDTGAENGAEDSLSDDTIFFDPR